MRHGWALWVVCLGLGCGGLEASPGSELADTPASLEAETEVEAAPAAQAVSPQWRAAGATRWVRTVRDSVLVLGIGVDRKDNTFVALTYESERVDLGGGALPGSAGIGVAKYAPDGRHLWSRGFPSTGGILPVVRAVAVDQAGNVYLTGKHFDGALSLGGAPLPGGAFLAKYAPDGRHLWSRTWAEEGPHLRPMALAVDEHHGQVVVAGNQETPDHVLVGAVIARVGMEDGAGGAWKSLAVSGAPVVQGLAVDPSGHLAVVGYFSETVDLGGGPLHTPLFITPFVARYSPEGRHLWSRDLKGAEGLASGVAVTGSRLLVVGEYTGSFRFQGQERGADGQDAFIASYSAAGGEQWMRHFAHGAAAVAVDHQSQVVVVGQYRPGDSAGGARLPFRSADDFEDNHVFVTKLERGTGKHTWSRGLFADVRLRVRGLALTRGGEPSVLGNFELRGDFGTGPVSVPTDSAVILRLGR